MIAPQTLKRNLCVEEKKVNEKPRLANVHGICRWFEIIVGVRVAAMPINYETGDVVG